MTTPNSSGPSCFLNTGSFRATNGWPFEPTDRASNASDQFLLEAPITQIARGQAPILQIALGQRLVRLTPVIVPPGNIPKPGHQTDAGPWRLGATANAVYRYRRE